MKIGYLLGAGISLPAGLPTTQIITQRVLKGENVAYKSDDTFVFGQPEFSHVGIPDEYVPRIIDFVQIIKLVIDDFYLQLQDYSTNYEEIYYVIKQLSDTLYFEYENPALHPLVKIVKEKSLDLCEKRNHDIKEEWSLKDLVDFSLKYIRDIVWRSLSPCPKPIDYLKTISDSINDCSIGQVDIFTLNHDLVIERFLKQSSLRFNDGFTEPINNVRYWKPSLYSHRKDKTRLFKLHGSINWFYFANYNNKIRNNALGIPLNWQFDYTVDPKGKRQYALIPRPEILIGTFNKILDYSRSIFLDLHYSFYTILKSLDCLIITGYSFGDKAINTRIIEWLYDFENSQVIVVNPSMGLLRSKARPAFSSKWNELVTRKKLHQIEHGIEEITWYRLKNILHLNEPAE